MTMRTKFFLLAVFIVIVVSVSQAQHVRARISFPAGVSIGAPGPAPFVGAIWIGPEWRWRSTRYECVSGYWARPHRHRAIWIPGYWRHTRWGWRWIPGYWR